MTKIDDATQAAAAFLKGAENVVQSYRAMSTENRARLAQWFPTLATACQLLGAQYDGLTK